MKATITSTSAIVPLDKDGKVMARVWEGESEDGVPFVAYIAFVQVKNNLDQPEFERDLIESKQPLPGTSRAINLRMIL